MRAESGCRGGETSSTRLDSTHFISSQPWCDAFQINRVVWKSMRGKTPLISSHLAVFFTGPLAAINLNPTALHKSSVTAACVVFFFYSRARGVIPLICSWITLKRGHILHLLHLHVDNCWWKHGDQPFLQNKTNPTMDTRLNSAQGSAETSHTSPLNRRMNMYNVQLQ